MDERRSSMKIHRVVQMLGATTSTGKLASDMYDLGHKDYYSEAEGRYIPISHMDFQHMVRAFVKLCEQEEMLDRSENMGRVKDQAKFYDDVIENNDRIYKKNLEELQEKYEQEIKYKEFWKKAYYDEANKLGKGYVFSEIPNDTDGQEFVDKMKKFFNRTSYKMRVRGQHIKPELKGTGATYWGQNLNESTHMRIYIEAKKGD
jgi:hypothetical protein